MTHDPWLRKDSASWLRISRSARYGNSNARLKWLRMMRRRSTTMASLSLGLGVPMRPSNSYVTLSAWTRVPPLL